MLYSRGASLPHARVTRIRRSLAAVFGGRYRRSDSVLSVDHRAASAKGIRVSPDLHCKLSAFFRSFLRAGYSERRSFRSASSVRGSLMEVAKKFTFHAELRTWI